MTLYHWIAVLCIGWLVLNALLCWLGYRRKRNKPKDEHEGELPL